MKRKNSSNTSNTDFKPTSEDIATAAYHLYVESGYQDGHDQEHWLRAENLLTQKAKSVSNAQVAESKPANAGKSAESQPKATPNKPQTIQLPWNPEQQATRPAASASRAA